MNETKRCRLMDPGFVYRKADATDLEETFKRIRREQAKQQKATTVTPIKRVAK